MWFIVLLICFGESLLCNAQHEVDLDPQSVSEVDQPNQGVNWDNARHPVTLSIRDGRSETAFKPPDVVPGGDDRQLFYSNEWHPFLMPIGFNHYEDRSRVQAEGEDPRFPPTFLRRPDADANNSAASVNAEREAVASTQVPFSPIVLYPNPFNLYPSGSIEGSNIRILQNSSTPYILTDSIPSNAAEENQNESEVIPITPDLSSRLFPLDFYRQLQEFTSPRARVYLPSYPPLPFARDVPIPSILSPNFNREPRSEVDENISPITGALGGPTTSGGVPEETGSSETLPNSIVPPPLPFPVGAYPFRIVPPAPFVPPMIPNTLSEGQPYEPSSPISNEQPLIGTLPRSITFNTSPFLRFTNIRPENQVDDTVLPPAPVLPAIVAGPPLEPVDGLDPALDLPISVEVDGENGFQGTDSNAAKIPYEFGFDMNDGLGTDQHRKEVSDGSGVVTGSYGYRDLFGVYRLVNYIADKGGFRAIIKSNEPGVASSRSANVVVMAEPPPPHAVAEGITASEPEVVIAAADEAPELAVAASGSETK